MTEVFVVRGMTVFLHEMKPNQIESQLNPPLPEKKNLSWNKTMSTIWEKKSFQSFLMAESDIQSSLLTMNK